MNNLTTWQKAWALLDTSEQRNAWITLCVVILSALSSAVMVGSVMPFLAVLAEPSRIQEVPVLARAYAFFGFGSEYGFLVALGLSSFAVILLTSLIQIAKTWVVARFALMRVHSISHRLLASYLAQPYAFFLNRHSGEMGPKILTESEQVVLKFLAPAAEVIAASFTVLAIVGLLLWVEPLVALIAFAVLGGSFAVVYLFSRRFLRQLGRIRVESNQQRFRLASEALTGIKDIKLLGREAAYLKRYALPSIRMARSQVNVSVISQVPQLALQAVALGGIILLCLLLIDPTELAAGATLGDLLPVIGVFAFAGQRLMPELSKLYNSLAHIQAGAAAVDSVYEDLVARIGPAQLSEKAPTGLMFKDTLRLDNISYHYPNAENTGVSNISLSIKAGERVGIVGSTGAGKTTLVDVILGLLEPNHGKLIADQTEITQETLRAWMQSVGYVPQDIFLTDAPVADNIALGVPPEEIDHDRVRKAAQIARIDAFIMEELPEGYQTHVGERGVRLSGGQRQRVGIARALYNEANFIIFDEATSALDNLTEQEVMEAIEAMTGDKTVLMIAHRLSTVKRCDRIIVLDKGSIVGCGSWTELMAENTTFQRIARMGETS